MAFQEVCQSLHYLEVRRRQPGVFYMFFTTDWGGKKIELQYNHKKEVLKFLQVKRPQVLNQAVKIID